MAHSNKTDDVTKRGLCLSLGVLSIVTTIYVFGIIVLLNKPLDNNCGLRHFECIPKNSNQCIHKLCQIFCQKKWNDTLVKTIRAKANASIQLTFVPE